MASPIPRLVVRQTSDQVDSKSSDGLSKFIDGSKNISNQSSLRSGDSFAEAEKENSLHVPSTPRLSHSDSNYSHSRTASVDDDFSGSQAGLDPVTQLVLKRTIPTGGWRSSGEAVADQKSVNEGLQTDGSGSGQSKEKRHRVSVPFLSRLVGNKRKDGKNGNDDVNDSASEYGDVRPEGANVQPFSEPIDNLGYSPRSPLPPSYIKIRAKNRKTKPEFDRIFLAQGLKAGLSPRPERKLERRLSDVRISRSSVSLSAQASEKQPIWTMEFSKDGRYLAAAGQCKVVRVWAVLSTPEERRAHEKVESKQKDVSGERLSAPVFHSKVHREYEGHTSTVLDLSWSKNNFLLSSSMDKTVRLWHVSRDECLCTFKHSDFVPSIRFHPKDDRFFLAGSLDSKLRLWSIPDKSVAYWSQLPEMITAVSFTPDGKTAIAGCLNGICVFYDTEGLKYQTQIQVRSSHGKNAKGTKITGIRTATFPPGAGNGEVKMLISSNDSRVRLYNLRDKSLELKFKGHENSYSQIRATFADDGRYIICGSEDRKVFIWPTNASNVERHDKLPLENFEAHNSITTSAVLAPTRTRQLLSASEDPLFDVCNPPPVTLTGKTESVNSSKPPTENGSAHPTPAPTETSFKKAEETPAYLTRTAHPGGHIVVTADYTGSIKVFRQDCAFNKRKSHDFETASMLSKRIGNGRKSRPLSLVHHHKGGTDSPTGHHGLHLHSDRIQSWRHSVHGIASLGHARSNGSLRNGSLSSQRNSMSQVSMTSLRNNAISNHNHNHHNHHNHGHNHRETPKTPQDHQHSVPPTPQTGSISKLHKQPSVETTTSATQSFVSLDDDNPTSNGDRTDGINDSNKSAENPLWIQGEQSYLFWDKQNYASQVNAAKRSANGVSTYDGIDDDTHGSANAAGDGGSSNGDLLSSSARTQRPGLLEVDRQPSALSALSSDVSSLSDSREADTTATSMATSMGGNAANDADDEVQCGNCGSASFKAKMSVSGGKGGGQTLVCTACGTAAS